MVGAEPNRDSGRAAERRARYREIARILWEERLLDAVKGIGLEEYVPANAGAAGAGAASAGDLPRPVRIRRAFERLGPVYVKIGQMLATRGDIVPPALLKELAKLQDEVPPVPWPEAKACIEAELGASVQKLFKGVKQTPIAAASIGQVYRGILRDGTRVAIKVRRPGVAEAMDLDLEILNDLARKLASHTEWARDNQVVEFVSDFSAVLRAELDYTNEGHWLDRFRDSFADDDSIVFPRVHWDKTTAGVLTMELVEGVPATHLESGATSDEVDRSGLVETGVGAYFRMIFQLGFYHADPHAGNLFALPGGRLGFVDFGRVARASQRTREGAFDMLVAMLDDDSAAVTEAAISLTGIPTQLDVASFELDVSALMGRFRKQQEGGEGLGKLMQGMLRLMRDHKLQIPGELSLLLSTLGVLDGVAHQIDPEFRMMDAAKPFARKYLPERYSPEQSLRNIARSARAYGRLIDEFPVQAARALRRVGEGEFKVAVRPSEYQDVVQRLTAVVYLLAYALIVGALIIGFAFLAGRQGLSLPELFVYRAILFLAIASAIGLFVTVIRNERRRRQADKQARR